MTAREMQIAFDAWFDRAGTDHGLNSDEVYRYLNEAQDIIVEEMFARFETDQIITDDLRVLVARDQEVDALYAGADAAINGFNADYATLPADYRYLISSRTEVKFNTNGVTIATNTVDVARTITGTSTTRTVMNRVSQSDDIYRLLLDPFSRTRYSEPLGVVNGARLYVYTESTFICERFFLDYISTPDTISLANSVDCELPVVLHREVVDRAIDRFVQRSAILRQPSNTGQ